MDVDFGFLVSLMGGYSLFLLYTLFNIVHTIIRNRYEFKYHFNKGFYTIAEVIFTLIAPVIGFMRYDSFGYATPFANQHVIIIVLLVFSSTVSFWSSKIAFNSMNPFLRIIISVGLFQGIILCGIVAIHFAGFMINGIAFPLIGFELVCPLMSFFILLRQYYFYSKIHIDIGEQLPYRAELGLIPLQYRIMQLHGISKLLIFMGMVFILVFIQMLFGCLIGLDLDAIVKAFTHSHQFVFSMD